jgi:hypothetical protein
VKPCDSRRSPRGRWASRAQAARWASATYGDVVGLNDLREVLDERRQLGQALGSLCIGVVAKYN